MAHYQFLDELVKEFLLFRGFTSTVRAMDADLKAEKTSGLRVDKILETFSHLISSHDLPGLLELWRHFETKLFILLDSSKTSHVKKLETSLLKLYLVSCQQSKQQERIREFFTRLAPELAGQSEWKEWFSLPFLPNPQDSPAFSVYFSRGWQDTVMLSLNNFLVLVFQGLPKPRLADYTKTVNRIKALRKEITQLKRRLAEGEGYEEKLSIEPPARKDIMDDFFLIAQESSVMDTQSKSIKSFLKTFTGGSVGGERKKSPRSESKTRSSSRVRSGESLQSSMSSISKQPLKRVNQSINPLAANSQAQQSSLGPAPIPAPQAQEDGNGQEVLEIDVPKTPVLPNFADSMSPEVSDVSDSLGAVTYLLLGQEEYSEHRGQIQQIEVSSAGSKVVSSDQAGVLKVWCCGPPPVTVATFISGAEVVSLTWVQHSERYFLYGTKQGQVRLCDVLEKMSVAEVSPELLGGESVTVLLSAPSGNTFFCSSGTRAFLCDTRSCKLERELALPLPSSLTCAAFNHNGSLLVHGTSLGKICLSDPNRGELLASWAAHSSSVSCLRLSKDGTKVWSLDTEGRLCLSSTLQTGSRLWETMLGSSPVSLPSFCLCPQGDHMLTGGQGGGLVFSLGQGEGALHKVLGLRSEEGVSAVAWSMAPTGTAFTGCRDGSIFVYTLLRQ